MPHSATSSASQGDKSDSTIATSATAAVGSVVGLGPQGYALAVRYLLERRPDGAG